MFIRFKGRARINPPLTPRRALTILLVVRRLMILARKWTGILVSLASSSRDTEACVSRMANWAVTLRAYSAVCEINIYFYRPLHGHRYPPSPKRRNINKQLETVLME